MAIVIVPHQDYDEVPGHHPINQVHKNQRGMGANIEQTKRDVRTLKVEEPIVVKQAPEDSAHVEIPVFCLGPDEATQKAAPKKN